MDIQGIHVEDCCRNGPSPGTGWIQRTWESSLLTTARQEIAGLLKNKSLAGAISKEPKLVVGDPDEEICRELSEGGYTLFVEGMLKDFDPAHFCRGIQAQRYRLATCPVLLVKNMPAFRQVAILLCPDDPPAPLVDALGKLFPGSGVAIDVIEVGNDPVHRASTIESRDGSPAAGADLLKLFEKVGGLLRHYRRVNQVTDATGLLRNYSLVVSDLPRHIDSKAPLVKVLNHVPCANLLCSLN
jgi:hypothetical protein